MSWLAGLWGCEHHFWAGTRYKLALETRYKLGAVRKLLPRGEWASWCLEGKVVLGSREMPFPFGWSFLFFVFFGKNFWWTFCWGIGWLLPLMLGWDSIYPSGKSLIRMPYSPASLPEPWPINIFIPLTSHLCFSSSSEISPYFSF